MHFSGWCQKLYVWQLPNTNYGIKEIIIKMCCEWESATPTLSDLSPNAIGGVVYFEWMLKKEKLCA